MTAAYESSAPFSLALRFEGARVVFEVGGELDFHRAPELRAMLDAVIERGHQVVVLDLDHLEFIDASSLGVIGNGAGRLRHSGGELIIRSPSAMVGRLLDITGLAAFVRLEQAPRLGAEQRSAPTLQRRQPLLQAVTTLRADGDLVDATLRLVVSLARATVGGADGASVSLRRNGRLGTVAASDRTISEMDANQYATGEGPCIDASIKGRWFHAESLGSEQRWPAFTPRARALGINAILSSPLLVDDRPVGALNIYSRGVAAFAPRDQELASLFATETSVILADADLAFTDSRFALRFVDAQRVRLGVALAQGIIMEREGIDEEQAFTLLREFSQRSSRPLRERAEDIISSVLRDRPPSRPGEEHRD